jgi:site-specific recombinase XerD
MRLIEAYEKFIVDKTVENCADSTIQNYRNMILYYVRYVGEDKEVTEVQDVDCVKRYILSLKRKEVAGKTIHTYIKHIKVFYSWLVNNGYIKYNSVSDLKIKYEKKYPQVLTTQEVKELLDVLDLRDRLILVIALDCGLRKKELVNLKVSHIEKDRIYVKLGKGRKDRVVPLSDYTYQLVQEYLASRPKKTEHLFQCYNSSKPLGYAGIRQLFRRLQEKTAIDRLTPHLLRHTYGTYYINSGGDIKVLQLLLGHSEVKTTETYVHLSNMLNVTNYAKHSIINIMTSKKDG